MKVKVLKKSNDGFKNYNQNHLKSKNQIKGCYCFVEKLLKTD